MVFLDEKAATMQRKLFLVVVVTTWKSIMSLMEKFGFIWSDGNSDYLKSTALLGDYSGWYHVTVNIDKTQYTKRTEQKFY